MSGANVDNCTGSIEPGRQLINFEAIERADTLGCCGAAGTGRIWRRMAARNPANFAAGGLVAANRGASALVSSMLNDECNHSHL
jgi:hypothetical protein